MTVAEYARLRQAIDDEDCVAIVRVLHRHTRGGLKKRHYACWYLAIDQAHAQIEGLEAALKAAQTQTAWCNALSETTWAKRE